MSEPLAAQGSITGGWRSSLASPRVSALVANFVRPRQSPVIGTLIDNVLLNIPDGGEDIHHGNLAVRLEHQRVVHGEQGIGNPRIARA